MSRWPAVTPAGAVVRLYVTIGPSERVVAQGSERTACGLCVPPDEETRNEPDTRLPRCYACRLLAE
ncbi:MAG: hypothetical protein H0V71_03795 [Chloroflexi bacterium]|nr:hypothetical protein [Chloroflexota bacterium]